MTLYVEVAPLGPDDVDAAAAVLAAVQPTWQDGRGAGAFLGTEWPAVGEPTAWADRSRATGGAWLARFADAPAGLAVARWLDTADGRIGRVDVVAVHPGFREVGVGEVLLETVAGAAQEAGCGRLDSVALPGDRHTKNFFESFGMKARLLVVSSDLPLGD